MEFSPEGVEELCILEGFKQERYKDCRGKWTIGFGHCIDDSDCIEEPLSEVQANALLARDVHWASQAVNDFVKVPLTQGQFDALVMFVYNTGRGSFAHSTLLKLLNLGHYEQIPKELRRYVYSGGQYLQGLVNRRDVEIKRWFTA